MNSGNNKKKSVKANYIFNLIYQLLLLVVPLFVTPYVARVLGSVGSGQYTYTFSLVSYFTLLGSLGFAYYAQRYIAKRLSDKKEMTIAFWELILCRFISTLFSLVIYVLLIIFNVYGDKYNLLMEIQVINIVALGFDISFFYQGKEEFRRIVFRNLIIKALTILCTFLFVKKSSDLRIYTLIQSLGVLISNLSLWGYLRKDLTKVSFSELHPIKHFLPSLLLFLPAIATTIYTSLDKSMISWITKDDSQTGNYEYADKLVKMALTCITSLGTIMISRNSILVSQKNEDGLKKNINKTCNFVFLLGLPITFGLISVSDNLIPWYLGEGYDYSIILLKILAPLTVIIGLSNILGLQLLIPLNKDKKFTLAIFCGAITNVIFNLILIPFLGCLGAGIATLISELTVTAIMLYFCKAYIEIKYLIKKFFIYLSGSLMMFAACLIESIYLESSILNSFLIVLTGISIYGIYLLVIRDEMLLNFLFPIWKKVSILLNKIRKK